MQLHQYTLAQLLTPFGQTLKVPYFQRKYQWEESNWDDLIEDIVNCYEKNYVNRTPYVHLMGPVVLQSNGNALTVIDGQQRLTTMSLLLLAFAKWLKVNQPNNTYLVDPAIKQYLIVNLAQGLDSERLTPTEQDNNDNIYKQLINDVFNFMPVVPLNALNGISPMEKAVAYLEKSINNIFNNQGDFSTHWFETITRNIRFIGIVLDANEDANTVFETLNARGKPLESGDLIRNYIFMDDARKPFYYARWQPIETYFNATDASGKLQNGEFSSFLRYYLIANGQSFTKNDNFYSEFKDLISNDLTQGNLNDLFTKFDVYKTFYDYVYHPENIPNTFDGPVVNAIILIKEMDLLSFTSVFMYLFYLHHTAQITIQQFADISNKIVSYSLRIKFSGKKSPSNKNIKLLINAINSHIANAGNIDGIIQGIADDNSFKRSIINNPIYASKSSRFLVLLIMTVIQSSNKFIIAVPNGATIEHIFPQNPDASWNKELNQVELNDNRQYCNTIGNLTIVNNRLNPALSNNCFNDKRCELDAYSIWPWERQEFFSNTNVTTWNVDSIKTRAEKIADIILSVFP